MALFQRGEGARFTGKTDPVMEKFNNSLNVDRVMWMADIDGSIAYSQCIEAAGVLSGMADMTACLMRYSTADLSVVLVGGTYQIKICGFDVTDSQFLLDYRSTALESGG